MSSKKKLRKRNHPPPPMERIIFNQSKWHDENVPVPESARDNRYLNTLEMRARRKKVVSRPYSFQIEVTTKCNLACIMCSRQKYHGAGSDLVDDVLDPVLEQLFPFAQDIIVSSFGEPLLYPEISQIFEHIDEDSGLELGFFSNFLPMDEKTAELVIRSGVAYINVSIDGATKETYEKIRKGGNWEELCEKLKMFDEVKKRLGSETPRLMLCVVGSTLNIAEIPLFVEFAKKYGFHSFKFNHNMYVDEESMEYMSLVHAKEEAVRMYKRGHRRALELGIHANLHKAPYDCDVSFKDENKLSPDTSYSMYLKNKIKFQLRSHIGKRIKNTWTQSGKTKKNFVSLFGVKTVDYLYNLIPGIPKYLSHPHNDPNDAPPPQCGNPWTHVHVKTDGLVYPCCFSHEVMGDLRKQTFEEIWNGKKYQALRESMRTSNYWPSCLRASCNWIGGKTSETYGCKIEIIDQPETIDGTSGATIRLRVTNTSEFDWHPKRYENQKPVAISYRVFNKELSLLDEGTHEHFSKVVEEGETIEHDLHIRPLSYAGDLLFKFDVVHEGITWFGERGNNALETTMRVVNVPLSVYLWSWNHGKLRDALNRPLVAGEELNLPVRVINVGTEPLGGPDNDDYVSYHIKAKSGDYVEWEGLRTPIRNAVEPEKNCNLEVPVRLPSDLESGNYQLELDYVREDECWVSEKWGRPLLSYSIKVHASDEIPDDRETAVLSRLDWTPQGQCAPITGNKGIW